MSRPPRTGISFVLDGKPIAWGRARRNGATYFTAPKEARYRDAIRHAAKAQTRGQVVSGAVIVTVEAVLPVPTSYTKAHRRLALDGDKMPTGRPDVDNYAKIVMDALNGIAWKDDSQVVELRASKRYGEHPYLRVTVNAV